MAKDDDLVADVIRAVVAVAGCPALTAKEVLTIETQVRERWGGSRVYIGRGAAIAKARCCGAALAAGATIREAFEQAGLTRRSGWRTLSRKWSIR